MSTRSSASRSGSTTTFQGTPPKRVTIPPPTRSHAGMETCRSLQHTQEIEFREPPVDHPLPDAVVQADVPLPPDRPGGRLVRHGASGTVPRSTLTHPHPPPPTAYPSAGYDHPLGDRRCYAATPTVVRGPLQGRRRLTGSVFPLFLADPLSSRDNGAGPGSNGRRRVLA